MRLWWPLFVVAFMQIHHEIMGFFNDNCQFCSSGPQPTIARQRNDDVHPHVDIFYLVINNPQLEYISKGRFWVLPTMAMVYSRLIPNHKQNGVSFNVTRDSNASTIIDNGRDTRVHIVTDHLPIIQQAQKLGLYAHDIKEYLAQLPKHIVKNVHDGTTSVEYEVTFLRWIVFNRIVQQWNGQWAPSQSLRPIERILVLDLDAMLTYNAASYFHFSIVALTNASLSEPTSYSPDSFDYVNVALGAISLFSVPGLANFSQEVYSFFDDADAVVVNKRCKAFHPNFSDMMFLKWFIARNPSRRSVCYEYDPGYQCLLARLGCVPISNYKDMLNHPDRKLEFHVRDESVITWTKNHPHLSKLAADHRPPDFHLFADWQHAPVCAIVRYPPCSCLVIP